MKYEIKNRWTGDVQFTAEINCDENTNASIKIGLAIKWAIDNNADLRGADLRGANLIDADLRGANIRDANIRGANIRDANLRGADIRDANLRGADLRDADLRGANIRGANIRDANLRGADLRMFKHDIWGVLMYGKNEVTNLIKAIKNGKIDGSCYEGECCCLCGTLEKGLEGNIKIRNAFSPAEQWFSMISTGDTPDNNHASKLALEWIEEWVDLNEK